jgi:hypothetical protein
MDAHVVILRQGSLSLKRMTAELEPGEPSLGTDDWNGDAPCHER